MIPFKLYVLPVSGGAFPIQLAFLTEIYQAHRHNKQLFVSNKDYKPDLILAASGGNVASYIGLGADWNLSGMERMIHFIDSKIFVDSWLVEELNFIPTWVFGIFMGSIFRSGKGPKDILHKFFDTHSIQDVEILTLTCNKEKIVPQIFSNRSKENSLFKTSFDHRHSILYELQPIIFCSGNLEEISKVCMASAALPMVTQPQKIGNNTYSDGGLVASSPFPLMAETLEDYINLPLQIYLLSPIELDNEGDITKFKIYGEGDFKMTLLRMSYSQMLNERTTAIRLLEKMLNRKLRHKIYKKVDSETLAEVFKEYENESFMIMFYPSGCPKINLTEFKSDDIIKLIDDVKKEYHFDLWY